MCDAEQYDNGLTLSTMFVRSLGWRVLYMSAVEPSCQVLTWQILSVRRQCNSVTEHDDRVSRGPIFFMYQNVLLLVVSGSAAKQIAVCSDAQ
jgi:hypothetical protein